MKGNSDCFFSNEWTITTRYHIQNVTIFIANPTINLVNAVNWLEQATWLVVIEALIER